MALERKTLFEKVEMDKDGNLSVLLKKSIVDGTELLSFTLHRIMVPAGQDVNAFLDAASTHIQAQGFPDIPAAVRFRATQVKATIDSLPAVERPTQRSV